MSVEISGLGINLNSGVSKTAYSNSASDFSEILKKSSAANGIDLDALFSAASDKYGVPLGLLKAVAKAESNFNPKAKSPCGAMGIMQLMPGTAKGLGVIDAYNPEQNIMGGAKYLSQLIKQFDGDTKLAVAAYNAGPNNVLKYDGIPPFKETQNYVRKVMGYLGENITAGSIAAGNSSPVNINTAFLPGVDTSDLSDVGSLLEGALLSGSLDGDLTNLLGTLEDSDPKDASDNIMMSIYQLQLQMMQSDDKDGTNVIV